MIKRDISIPVYLLLCCAVAFARERNACPNGSHSLYAREAVTLDTASDHQVRLTSPDGNKTLTVKTVWDKKTPDGAHISYSVRVAGKTFGVSLLGFNGEVAWAPDSKAFAVTQTEGGGSIGSRVYGFYVEDTGLHKVDVSRPIEQHFGHPVKCEINVPPNTGFVSWGRDSSTLLVAAEVVPVSICSCMGTYRVYEMNLPSATIARRIRRSRRRSNSGIF